MRPIILESENATYGVVLVPETDTLAIFFHEHDGWWGLGSANTVGGTTALVGRPLPDVCDALNKALLRTSKTPLGIPHTDVPVTKDQTK